MIIFAQGNNCDIKSCFDNKNTCSYLVSMAVFQNLLYTKLFCDFSIIILKKEIF